MGRALLIQPLGDLQTVYRMHPCEVFRDDLAFITLDGPDEVPANRQIRQLRHFGYGFLSVILAKILLPGFEGLADVPSCFRLADREKCDVARISSGVAGTLLNHASDLS